MIEKLAQLEKTHEELTQRLADPAVLTDRKVYAETNKALAEINSGIACATGSPTHAMRLPSVIALKEYIPLERRPALVGIKAVSTPSWRPSSVVGSWPENRFA